MRISSAYAKKFVVGKCSFRVRIKGCMYARNAVALLTKPMGRPVILVYFSLDFESEIFLMIWVDGAVVVPVFYVDCCHPIVVR